jgi:16S rRNA (guanine527-N7)-methyltransferase
LQDITNILIDYAKAMGLEVTPNEASSFQKYIELLIDWNTKINLTTITEPCEVAAKHFLDSIMILKYVDIPSDAKFIDVGTGAGFPGLPLKVMKPKLKVTLLDGLNKRLKFLKDVSENLYLPVELVHARAEEAGRQKQFRQKFDFASARAVAQLNVLCEYCLPFIKINGTFIAMKGPNPQEEIKNAENAISLLGCELAKVKEFQLPNGDSRSLIFIKRTKPLSDIYPRHGSKISKKPL